MHTAENTLYVQPPVKIIKVKQWMKEISRSLMTPERKFYCSARSKDVAHIRTVNIGNSSVNVMPQAKNIGCFLESNLTMEAQVANVTRKCYASIHEIGRILLNLTKEAAEILINSQITSKLDNFSPVLCGISGHLMHKLQLVQNSAARLIAHTKKHDHITPVLKKLHWLHVSFGVEYKILLLCFKALHSMAPQYLCELIKKKISTRDLRPSSIRELIELRSNRRKYGDRASPSLPQLCVISYQAKIKSTDKLEPFKTKLKPTCIIRLLSITRIQIL